MYLCPIKEFILESSPRFLHIGNEREEVPEEVSLERQMSSRECAWRCGDGIDGMWVAVGEQREVGRAAVIAVAAAYVPLSN
ncbi:hypothetical protein NDU88_004232 [Pleurodeles waltl]|uniref:Uncharacterized protein n=1 Tax=Pleurodeles waltl TaxID=8319 RepID=A0AAV7QBN8_PLEWA|nr:hypothetical protein NDU88_004232 [Pleurodeles waltl]